MDGGSSAAVPPLLRSACAIPGNILPADGLGLSRSGGIFGERFRRGIAPTTGRPGGPTLPYTGLHCRLEASDEKLDRHPVEASFGDDHVGISLGRLHELQVHGAYDVEILIHH
jgi:hypothetical protein